MRYVQIFRRLERAYDQMSHPQKRVEVKKALEATIGRCLELRHWVMKKFARELDHVSLDEVLQDMNLPYNAMEIPLLQVLRGRQAARARRARQVPRGSDPQV